MPTNVSWHSFNLLASESRCGPGSSFHSGEKAFCYASLISADSEGAPGGRWGGGGMAHSSSHPAADLILS